jgi:hypothetical protein
MIVAAGVIGSFLVAWANSSFAQQSGLIANQTTSRINLAKEGLVVEDVWFKCTTYSPCTSPRADVTIRNTGDVAVKVTYIYVNNTKVWITGQSIPIGTYATITTNTFNWGSGKIQSIWVQSERGSNIHQEWKS